MEELMPTIKFKLKDPKYCNGCPAYTSSEFGQHCNLNLRETEECFLVKFNRPQSCVDKYGE